jgi:uncharacterized SAM-binding protein YcdF (DUF218 family)
VLRFLRFIPGASFINPWAWMRRIAVLLVVGYSALSVFSVWSGANRDDSSRRADVIVILGAAQYNGTPSPVLKRRLDHALVLYRARRAPLMVVTGGRQKGDRMTEASAAANYLMRNGVPDARIEREVDGHDTYSSLAAVARFLHRKQTHGVIFVTDRYHAARVRGIGREVGLGSQVSPVGHAPNRERLFRESVAVGLGELVGYRRLSVWTR